MAGRGTFELADTAMGGRLRAELKRLRDQGQSYDAISREFAARGVDVSRETIRRWVAELDEVEAAPA